MSMERPVLGGLSPSLSVLYPASEIKGRLNFSSVKTPQLKTKKLFLSDVRTPSNFNNRLGEYHMSKQNPAVLDQMYSASSPQKDQLYKTVTPLMSHSTRLNGSGILGNDNTSVHTSLLKQTLGKIHRNSLPGHSSLVQLAVRGTQRQYDSIGISPVVIRLSGPDPNTSGEMKQESGMETNSGQTNGRVAVVNPCDKNVVLSALKQKRKRWATSSDDDSLTDVVLPQAKRSRHSTQASSSAPSSPSCNKLLFERKRSNMASTTQFSPAVKRSRVADLLVDNLRTRCLKNSPRQFSVPEIEYESDGESESGEAVRDVREASVGSSDAVSVGTRSVGSSEKERSATPPAQEEEEDVELKKRQKESLKLQKSLTAVFPSSLTRKSSSRRKLPVFCATGSKPHLPAPLSVTHSATQDDLKRDREAAASRIKHFLSEDEEQPQKDDASTVSSAPATVSSSALSTALPTTSATNGGLQLGLPVTLPTVSTDQTSAVASTVASTTALSGLTSTGPSQVPSIHGSSLVCTTATNVPVMSTGLSSLSAPLTSVSSLPKSVSFALPSSATGSVTTTQSQIQMAAASTSASALPSQTDTQLKPRGLGSSGASIFSKGATASLPSAATSTNQLSLPFQFPPATTTSSSSGSFTIPTSVAGNQQSQQQSAISFQFGPVPQNNLFAGIQSASSIGAPTNTSVSVSLPTTSSQQTLAGLFSQNATSLQTSSSNLFAGIQNGPSNGTGTSTATSVAALPTSTFFATPFQTSSSGLFSGVPSNGNAAGASLALPTAASQQTLQGFFSQNTTSLQTASSNLFAGASNNSNGTNTSVPTLALPRTTSQQTLNFFAQNATPLQASSANLFPGMKTTGANTSTSNTGFTFNLTSSPFTSQQKQSQFGQLQTATGMGMLQNGTNQNRSVKFNIPTTAASNGFPSGTQQQQQHQQQQQQQHQQQQNKAISFFGTNAPTKPPSFNFTAGVGGLNSTQSHQINTAGLFPGNPKSNGSSGFNFSANSMPSQNSAGFFNSAQQLAPATPSTFNFAAGVNPNQPPSQQQPNAFFSGAAGVNQTPNKAKPGLPFSQTQGSAGLFNFTTNGSAQSQNGGAFSSGLKSPNQMALGQHTTQNQTQNGFDFTAGTGMGVRPFNFTGDVNPSFNQPSTMFGNQGNTAPGFGGFQTPQTALSFATPSNGGLNFNFGVGGGSADSSRRPRRRRGRK